MISLFENHPIVPAISDLTPDNYLERIQNKEVMFLFANAMTALVRAKKGSSMIFQLFSIVIYTYLLR